MSTTNRYSELPQFPESIWRATTEFPPFERLAEDIQSEVTVVGAGIAGITTAYLLAQAGKDVVVLEAGSILDGTTGHTTAKITSQHGVIYDELLRHFGEEQARQYYEANEGALHFIRNLVKRHGIDCQLKDEDAYVYVQEEKNRKQLEDEFKAYEKLGIPGEWVDRIPLPVMSHGAIRLGGQAQFHPLEYLKFMVHELQRMGVRIYEHTTADKIEEHDDHVRVTVQRGYHNIDSQHVVSTSHFPFYDPAMYFARLHAERSYAIAIKPETTYAGGMYITADTPDRSFRSVLLDGEELVIVGGENHKTGQGICTFGHYERLEAFAGQTLGIRQAPYRWSAQDLITLDKVPYIGQISGGKDRVFVATGFAKWGMTHGTLAGQMLSSQILGQDNPYTDLFTPSRFKASPSIKNFVVQNANVAKELISGKVDIVHTHVDDLGPDEGAIVRHDGRKAGAYRDKEGNLHLVDATCTHMGCEVEWNNGERSWDCPCHGSRFGYDGHVIEGPAKKDLDKLSQ
ncbi:FAD-dependent oxidoreductase [Paenibacillus sp. JX-17]|uniref:FAD-dependent oxidoreductase n=1 Tax=Paenibacillus lacisoli TaxID=3064525 RepID=A0ABT9CAZ3_9BACL|nr:FAD-dependent oxidoreductase [Paenibacillus sp. JX-17]MDO7906422.1 FAD-dependent oxidoreductase [Paenibacillus sp. JX-17]